MIDLYDSYVASAERIHERIRELDEIISAEEDSPEREKLIARRDLLKSERYDMLSIAKSLKDGTVWGDFY